MEATVYMEKDIYYDIEEVLTMLSRKNRTKRPPSFLWSRVSDHVHRQILYMVAQELNLPNPRFIASKDLEKHRFKFINNQPLNGLYAYYKNSIPRKEGVHIITNICDILGIPQVSEDEWIKYIASHNIFSWKNIPDNAKRKVLLEACKELGYSHPLFIKNNDFSRKFKFLNGKTLTGYYTYFKNISQDIRGSVIKNICDMLDIEITEEDWITYITDKSVSIFWDVIPHNVIRKILYRAAEQLGYSNPRMMSSDDLKTGLDFLDGMSLYSFGSRFYGLERGGIRSIDFICDVYGIPELTFEEWLHFIAFYKHFKWEMVPKHFIARILSMKAEEEGKPNPRMLKVEELVKPSAFLNGKPLSSLYTYYSALAHDSGVDTITFMCDDLEIPDLNIEQWISIIENNDSKVTWGSVPNEICREILFMCAKELDLKNPRLMGYRDFCSTRFECLNGKTLSGLYSYYSLRVPSDDIPVVQFICDSIGIEKSTLNDWINMIASCAMCRWESIPLRVQREIVMRAAVEMEIFHPRLMGSKEFDSVELKFLNNKTLSGLYYHYAAKLKDPAQQITEFIFNSLSIPRIDINPKTGRLATLDNTSHRKYFDSLANIKELINEYLKHYDLKSLCRKYTFINNAKKAGIYRKGLVTILAPMNRKQYIDFLYEILKAVPRDWLGFRKKRNGDYRLLKSDLYKLAGIKEPDHEPQNRIMFAKPDLVPAKDKDEVIEELKNHKKILDIKVRKYHDIKCEYLVEYSGSFIFRMNTDSFPGEILTSDSGDEFEVIESREQKNGQGYIIELKALGYISEDEIANIKSFTKSSNDAIVASYIEKIIKDIEDDSLSPLLSVVLGLRKEAPLSEENIYVLSDDEYYDKNLLSNEAQKQAVALACTLDGINNVLGIVQGPPGTGKTTLIKEIALQYYYKGKNVLILAKTNVAVDNILEKLIQDKVRVLRTGNNIEFKSDLPYAPAVSTSNPAYMYMLGGKNKIVLGTPLGFYLDRNMEVENYDIVIIDEGSQMNIPETLFSLGFANKCVIIGDHLQIPPFPIPNEVLLEYDPLIDLYTSEELQKSLFEKLITDRNRFNSVFLDINYRTENPNMVSFISDLIYDGKLYPNTDSSYYKVPKQKRNVLFPQNPIEIIDTSEFLDPQTRSETEENSTYYNISEAMLSVKKVIELLEKGEVLEDICIITPYKAQTEKLKELFQENAKYFGDISSHLDNFIEQNIYTIDSFQGREQENVIINWVRSNYNLSGTYTRTGFLRDYRRINVALSRAKKRLILIGDFTTLTRSDNMKVQYIFSKIKNVNKNKKIVL
ncbi:MAG: AAA family ATPase [Clostridiales bacterium]|nr:AAA family ATPase [Clostridiales bacterium]